MKWHNSTKLESKNYIYGHCGNDITSNCGYYVKNDLDGDDGSVYIYICHKCNKPTFFDFYEQVSGAMYGNNFEEKIFEDDMIYKLYEEARKCMKINAFSLVGMCCRKLLITLL